MATDRYDWSLHGGPSSHGHLTLNTSNRTKARSPQLSLLARSTLCDHTGRRAHRPSKAEQSRTSLDCSATRDPIKFVSRPILHVRELRSGILTVKPESPSASTNPKYKSPVVCFLLFSKFCVDSRWISLDTSVHVQSSKFLYRPVLDALLYASITILGALCFYAQTCKPQSISGRSARSQIQVLHQHTHQE